jgi:hypothetical protein
MQPFACCASGVDGDLKAIAVLKMDEAQLCLGKSRLTYRQGGENTDKILNQMAKLEKYTELISPLLNTAPSVKVNKDLPHVS